MERWRLLLTWGAMLLPVLVNAEDCPLNGNEEHAWLIRLTPMLPIADAVGEDKPEGGATDKAKGGEPPEPPPAKMFKFHDSGLELIFRRYKRDDPPEFEAEPLATFGRAALSEEAPTVDGGAAPSGQPPAVDGIAPQSGQPPAAGGRAAPSEQPPAVDGTVAPTEQPLVSSGKAPQSGEHPLAGGRSVLSGQQSGTVGSGSLQGKPPAAPGHQGEAANPESRGGSLEPGVTTMHGALVTPKKVLTVLDITLDAWFIIKMKKGYLSLIGYNAGKKCSQEQWGLDVTFPESSTSFSLNAGLFLIINTYEPFAVEGKPFLFGPKGYPPVEEIVSVYHRLAKNPEGKVMMHLFKDNKAITDGSTLDVEFKFIPWKICGKMAAVTEALDKEGKGIDAQVAPEYFFCSEGIPGIMNETMGGKTEKFGFDWYRGAPVLYMTDYQTLMPIGHYVYRTGLTGDPRIYAAYNSKLSKTLGGPSGVPGSLTIAPPEDEERVYIESAPEVPIDQLDDVEKIPEKKLRAQTEPSIKRAIESSSFASIAEIWVVFTTAFAPFACSV